MNGSFGFDGVGALRRHPPPEPAAAGLLDEDMDGGGDDERQHQHGDEFNYAHPVISGPTRDGLLRIAPDLQDGDVDEVERDRGFAGEQGDGVGKEGPNVRLRQQRELQDEGPSGRHDDAIVGPDLHQGEQRDRGGESTYDRHAR